MCLQLPICIKLLYHLYYCPIFAPGDNSVNWTTNRFNNGKITVDLTDDLKTILSKTFYVAGSGTISKITVE